MKRGEIYYANLHPTMGSETAKRCPVLIVSNNANNFAAKTVKILTITSDAKTGFIKNIQSAIQQ
ncbi:MAG: type II toxin-antitoxin system PemK/MazF family toxin [Leptolyngbya sp. SIOISBB]|nr:type II toxin-antitoxin system PemK/MazF family toxin [Leptolyngbya sp. SIOISBB]